MFCGFGGSGFVGSGYGFSSWMFGMMAIRLVIFLGLIILGVKIIKNYTSNSNGALKILDEKFANGEFSEEEYIRRRNVITQSK